MRIVSWNVNGLHTTLKDAAARFSNASVYFITILHADIVCFQETKIQEDKLEKWMACVPGFESVWSFSQEKKGYSGVVTYVREDLSPLDAAADQLLNDGDECVEDLCKEGRVIETDHGSFVLINVYAPNAGDRAEGRPRLDFKLRFLQAFKRKCDEVVKSGKHLLVVGDFNIAYKAIDVHKKWDVEEIYTAEERAWMADFLTEYVDLFRHFHPDVRDVYSVWDQKTEARMHNEGLRIDYAVCDKAFLQEVVDTQILKMVPKKWSDHAAVVLNLKDQPALPPHPAPSISSRNMKRFQEDRRQRKLTSLFSRGASHPMWAAGLANDDRKITSATCDQVETAKDSEKPTGQTEEKLSEPRASGKEEAVPEERGLNGEMILEEVACGSRSSSEDASLALQACVNEGETVDEKEAHLEDCNRLIAVEELAVPSSGISETGQEKGTALKEKIPEASSLEICGESGKQRTLTSFLKAHQNVDSEQPPPKKTKMEPGL